MDPPSRHRDVGIMVIPGDTCTLKMTSFSEHESGILVGTNV